MDIDLAAGIPLSQLRVAGKIAGKLGDDQVLLVYDEGSVHAISATCTHYGAPLIDGAAGKGVIRCPWHHACFDLNTGAVLRAPALSPLETFDVELRDGHVFLKKRNAAVETTVVIVGAGAAATNVADTLRRDGYPGRVVMISSETDLPYDKPNLSKDFLAGAASADWLPLHDAAYYESNRIELRLGTTVTSIDPAGRRVMTATGELLPYDTLVLATGASIRRLGVPGSEKISYLRTRRDAEHLVSAASSARRAVVIGSSFIGLEVAASLRQKGLEVSVVSPTNEPLERILGPVVGASVRRIHEAHGVVFYRDRSVAAVEKDRVILSDGSRIECDLIVAGVGVSPNIDLARSAGVRVGDGILVDDYLQTSVPGVFACGDAASWPDPRTGDHVRVEHWVVAGRQGQTVARNIMGKRERFTAVPFFWSAHFDTVIAYVGHASMFDEVTIDGSLESNDATIVYSRGGTVLAVATIGRDDVSLTAEEMFEQGRADAFLGALVAG